MISKVFAFVALLCVVNAYVALNVFDDNVDIDISRASGARACSQQSCDQSCRRIGFPGGACVGDRCKCDILFSDDNELSAAAEAGVSAVKGAVNPGSSFALPFQAMNRACTSSLCVSVCRALGCTSGYCISSSTCQCYGC